MKGKRALLGFTQKAYSADFYRSISHYPSLVITHFKVAQRGNSISQIGNVPIV